MWMDPTEFFVLGHRCLGRAYEPGESLSCFLPAFHVPSLHFHASAAKLHSSKCKLILNYMKVLKETVNLSNTLPFRRKKKSLCLGKEGGGWGGFYIFSKY